MFSFDNLASVVTTVLSLVALLFFVSAGYNLHLRRKAERAAAAARDAEKLDSLRPVGLKPYEGADPEGVAWAARREIMRVLARKPHSAVVNGERVDVAALIAVLSTLRYPTTPHPHAQAPLKAFIATAVGQINLWLERDPEDRRTYWVFHPGLESTRATALGFVKTDLLDAFEAEAEPVA
jgi:hypothetical protein